MLQDLAESLSNHADAIKTAGQYIYYFKLFPGYGQFLQDSYDSSEIQTFNGKVEFLRVAVSVNIILILYLILLLG